MENELVLFDKYVSSLDSDSKNLVIEIKDRITSLFPSLLIGTSYGVASLKMGSRIFMFGASKNHIGVYPGPAAIDKFKNKLKDFEFSKGSIKFPKNKPLPFDLILDIASFVFKK